jgi:hypothetical protein
LPRSVIVMARDQERIDEENAKIQSRLVRGDVEKKDDKRDARQAFDDRIRQGREEFNRRIQDRNSVTNEVIEERFAPEQEPEPPPRLQELPDSRAFGDQPENAVQDPPKPVAEAENAAIEDRIAVLEGVVADIQATAGDEEEEELVHRPSPLIPSVPDMVCAAASTSASVGSAGGTTTGTFDLDGIDVEIQPAALDVDLANNKIIVKQGASGVYLVSIQVRGLMEHTQEGTNDASAVVKQDASELFRWELNRYDEDISAVTRRHIIRNTCSELVFVDASSADVDLTVDYDVDASNGGTVSLFLHQFSASLFCLTTDATA